MRKYVPVPIAVLSDKRLSDAELRLLINLIANYGNKKISPTSEALSTLAISKRTFYRLSDQLVRCQYLTHIAGTSEYSLSLSLLAKNSDKDDNRECQDWQRENEEERTKEEDKEYIIYNTNLDNSSEKVTENDKEKEIEKKEKPKRTSRSFVKPTVEEIRAYCKERHSTVSAQTFFDWYESNGWMVGRNHMKDFKAAVRTWEQKDKAKGITYIPPENREDEGDDPDAFPF